MQEPHERQEDRRPRSIEKGKDTVAGHESAQLRQIFQAGLAAAACEARLHDPLDHRDAEMVIEPLADACEDRSAGLLQQPMDGDCHDHREGEPEQRAFGGLLAG